MKNRTLIDLIEQRMKEKASKKEILLFFALILSLCVIGIFISPKTPYAIENIFAEALIYNDIDSAKRVSSPEIWPLLYSWPEKHQAIPRDCKFPSDPDVGVWSTSSRSAENDISSSYVIGRECPDAFYTITINDITLRKIDDRWKVISWGKYCESTSRSTEPCLELD